MQVLLHVQSQSGLEVGLGDVNTYRVLGKWSPGMGEMICRHRPGVLWTARCH